MFVPDGPAEDGDPPDGGVAPHQLRREDVAQLREGVRTEPDLLRAGHPYEGVALGQHVSEVLQVLLAQFSHEHGQVAQAVLGHVQGLQHLYLYPISELFPD